MPFRSSMPRLSFPSQPPTPAQKKPNAFSEAFDGAFDAWAVAHADIVAERDHLADPRNLRPTIPKAMREAANLVADHGGFLGEGMSKLHKRLSTVPPHSTQKQVREVVRDEALTPRQKIELLAELADELGLEEPPAPPEIDPVDPAEVHLVAWLGITAE